MIEALGHDTTHMLASTLGGMPCELVVSTDPVDEPELQLADVFNTPKYFALHAPSLHSAHYFIARHPTSRLPLAVAQVGEIESGVYRSPGRGSFGGVQLLAPKVDIAIVEGMVRGITAWAESRGAVALRMVVPPFDYHPARTALVSQVLLHHGFTLVGTELNYAIPVVGSDFGARLDHGNRKRLRAAPRLGMRFVRLEPAELPDAYTVVAENRAKRGYTLSMTLDQLEEMQRALPGRLRCFGVRIGADLVAAAICVQVSRTILYVFYWGEVTGVERMSPVSYMASEIYTQCVREDVRLLDIGTATLNGVPNYGLIRFKKNLGCRESLKLTLERRWPGAGAPSRADGVHPTPDAEASAR